MKKYIYYTLAFLMTTYSSFNAMHTDGTITEDPIFVKKGAICPCNSGAIKFDGKNFSIQIDDSSIEVKSHNIFGILKTISKEQLQKFQENENYISIRQFDNGEYALQAKARGFGGCSSQWFYESGCYGYEDPETVTPTVARLLSQHSHAKNIDPNTTNSTTTNSPQVVQRVSDTLQTETHCNTYTEQSNTK